MGRALALLVAGGGKGRGMCRGYSRVKVRDREAERIFQNIL
jgi:hypothetical protein